MDIQIQNLSLYGNYVDISKFDFYYLKNSNPYLKINVDIVDRYRILFIFEYNNTYLNRVIYILFLFRLKLINLLMYITFKYFI